MYISGISFWIVLETALVFPLFSLSVDVDVVVRQRNNAAGLIFTAQCGEQVGIGHGFYFGNA